MGKNVIEYDFGKYIDRSHEECFDCELKESKPPKCNGHYSGPTSCSEFQQIKQKPLIY